MTFEHNQNLIESRSNSSYSKGWRVLTVEQIDNMKSVFELVKDRPDEI
jgi:hypothetical protein